MAGGTLLIELTSDHAGDVLLDILLDDFSGEIASMKYTNDDGEVVIDERFEEQGVT